MGVPVLPSITAKVTDADRKGVSASYSLSSPRRQAPSDSLDQLSPAPWRGFLCNQRCGWALGWWACYVSGERQARYGNKHDPPSPANLAGLLLAAPALLCKDGAGLSANLLGVVAHNLSDGRCWPGRPTLPPSVGWPRSIRSGRPTKRRATNRLAEPEPGRRRRRSMSSRVRPDGAAA